MSLVIKFYLTSMLNMFRTLIHPWSGACDFSVVSPHWSCVLVSKRFGVSMWLGWGGIHVAGFSLLRGYHWLTHERTFEMVQRSQRLSTRRIAFRMGVLRMQVWWTLHEEDIQPYHDHRVQRLEPGDPARRMDSGHWITAHPQLLSIILFTDEASFTRDGINNSRNLHTWSHDTYIHT